MSCSVMATITHFIQAFILYIYKYQFYYLKQISVKIHFKIMDKKHFILLFLFISLKLFSQKNTDLVGRTYTKKNDNVISYLKFTSSNSGISESSVNVIGKNYNTKQSFSYKLNGKILTITYPEASDVEEYKIDDVKRQLISSHLEGYVDGVWGKVFWKRSDK